jgi:hypothetical protein
MGSGERGWGPEAPPRILSKCSWPLQTTCPPPPPPPHTPAWGHCVPPPAPQAPHPMMHTLPARCCRAPWSPPRGPFFWPARRVASPPGTCESAREGFLLCWRVPAPPPHSRAGSRWQPPPRAGAMNVCVRACMCGVCSSYPPQATVWYRYVPASAGVVRKRKGLCTCARVFPPPATPPHHSSATRPRPASPPSCICVPACVAVTAAAAHPPRRRLHRLPGCERVH